MATPSVPPEALYHGFLSTNTDLTIFVSCISAILGVVLVLSVVFFIIEKAGRLEKSTALPNKRSRDVRSAPNPYSETTTNPYVEEDPKPYPGVSSHQYMMSGSKTREQSAVRAPYTNGYNRGYSNNAMKSIYFDEQQETLATNTSHVAYQSHNPKAAKQKPKPLFYVAYKKKKKEKKINDSKVAGKKVAVPNEYYNEPEVSRELPSTSVPIENFDPLGALKAEEQRRAEEESRKVKRLVSMKDEVVPKVEKIHKSFTVKYEHPKIMSNERRALERIEEEKIEAKEKAKRTRRIASYGSN